MAKRNTVVRIYARNGPDGEYLEEVATFESVKHAYATIAHGDFGNGPFEIHTVWAEGVTLKPKAPEYELSIGARFGGGGGGRKPKPTAEVA